MKQSLNFLLSEHVITSEIALKITLPEKLQGLVIVGVLVGVGVGVAVGDGEIVIPVITPENPPQGLLVLGVGVGVGVGDGDGSGGGGGGIKQSNTALKSKNAQGSVVIGVVGQVPSLNMVGSKSGHKDNELVGPNKEQLPPTEVDKHHCVVPVL